MGIRTKRIREIIKTTSIMFTEQGFLILKYKINDRSSKTFKFLTTLINDIFAFDNSLKNNN